MFVARLASGFLFVCLVGTLSGCGSDSDIESRIQFGDQCYAVPRRHAGALNASAVFMGSSGSSSGSTILKFVARELAGETAFGKPTQVSLYDVVPLVALATPVELHRTEFMAQSFGYDIWYGREEYAARTIKPATAPGMYRIYPLGVEGGTWMVVTSIPDKTRRAHLQRDFWIASCGLGGGGKQIPVCTSHVVFPDRKLIVTLNLREQDLPLRERMAQRLMQAMDSWRVAC